MLKEFWSTSLEAVRKPSGDFQGARGEKREEKEERYEAFRTNSMGLSNRSA